jgi:hypothetical protein
MVAQKDDLRTICLLCGRRECICRQFARQPSQPSQPQTKAQQAYQLWKNKVEAMPSGEPEMVGMCTTLLTAMMSKYSYSMALAIVGMSLQIAVMEGQ